MTKQTSTQKRLKWLDNHLLELLAGFLMAFLPLYPKWPLFDALPGYIVRVRLEDFVVFFSFLIFLVQVKRGKAYLRKNPLFKPILVYLGIGLLSSLSAMFLTQSVPLETAHVGKLLLHWIRRVEYMSLALIFFSAITSVKSLKRIFGVFVITAVIVSFYGYGQKYAEWPVYSTMNREFAKGWRLVLTEHARVSSTFAGHYDLAAYLVVALMSMIGLIISFKKRAIKLGLFGVYLAMYGTLLLTASRTSFIAYLGAVVILSFVLIRAKGWKTAATYFLIFMTVSWIGVLSFGPMKDRFASLLRIDRVEKYITNKYGDTFKFEKYFSFNNKEKKEGSDLDLVYESGDTPPTAVSGNNNKDLPADVFEDIPESFAEASLSAVPATTGSGNEGKQRTYSSTAEVVGLSSAIRFDALWPRALEGFKKNPLLGTGYSTLVKTQRTDFTEAESTDNDYLRALGETGLLGLASFVFILGFGLWKAWEYLPKAEDELAQIFTIIFISGVIGLMINALYIDVFVSSKVAYTLWAFMGAMFGLIHVSESTKTKKKPGARKNKKVRG